MKDKTENENKKGNDGSIKDVVRSHAALIVGAQQDCHTSLSAYAAPLLEGSGNHPH